MRAFEARWIPPELPGGEYAIHELQAAMDAVAEAYRHPATRGQVRAELGSLLETARRLANIIFAIRQEIA